MYGVDGNRCVCSRREVQSFCSSSPMGWVLLQDMGDDYLFPFFVPLFALFYHDVLYRVKSPNHKRETGKACISSLLRGFVFVELFYFPLFFFPFVSFLFYLIFIQKLGTLSCQLFSLHKSLLSLWTNL